MVDWLVSGYVVTYMISGETKRFRGIDEGLIVTSIEATKAKFTSEHVRRTYGK